MHVNLAVRSIKGSGLLQDQSRFSQRAARRPVIHSPPSKLPVLPHCVEMEPSVHSGSSMEDELQAWLADIHGLYPRDLDRLDLLEINCCISEPQSRGTQNRQSQRIESWLPSNLEGKLAGPLLAITSHGQSLRKGTCLLRSTDTYLCTEWDIFDYQIVEKPSCLTSSP